MDNPVPSPVFQPAHLTGTVVALTPGEYELLTHATEEAVEVVQEICKIKRFGFESCHPLDPQQSNRQRLEVEIADFYASVELLVEAGLINPLRVDQLVPIRKAKKKKWLVHPLPQHISQQDPT